MASGPCPEPIEPIKRLATSGLLPPDLASKFPKGQVGDHLNRGPRRRRYLRSQHRRDRDEVGNGSLEPSIAP
jgi:hypothetical protein